MSSSRVGLVNTRVWSPRDEIEGGRGKEEEEGEELRVRIIGHLDSWMRSRSVEMKAWVKKEIRQFDQDVIQLISGRGVVVSFTMRSHLVEVQEEVSTFKED